MNLAPIVLFVYNRPLHTRQTIEALQKNELADESELIIYSDAPKNEDTKKNVEEVREYIKIVDGFKKVIIIEREKNWGLANSIIDGVTKIVKEYGKIIVLEDDLITSPYFLKFMNDGLTTFIKREDIFSITGFNYPKSILEIPDEYNEDIYLSYRCMSWGWATWIDRWEKVEWDIKDFDQLKNNKVKINHFNKGGEDLFLMLKNQMERKIDSWAIRFCYAHSVNNAYCVYPVNSLVNNEGFDGSGVHCGNDKNNRLKNDLLDVKNIKLNYNLELNQNIVDRFYLISKTTVYKKIKSIIKRFI